MKKINKKMQACTGVVDGASEALDVIAERIKNGAGYNVRQ